MMVASACGGGGCKTAAIAGRYPESAHIMLSLYDQSEGSLLGSWPQVQTTMHAAPMQVQPLRQTLYSGHVARTLRMRADTAKCRA